MHPLRPLCEGRGLLALLNTSQTFRGGGTTMLLSREGDEAMIWNLLATLWTAVAICAATLLPHPSLGSGLTLLATLLIALLHWVVFVVALEV